MNRKKVVLASATAMALSATLVACGGGGTDSGAKGPVTIKWWTSEEPKATEPMAAKFNATHKDIKLQVVKQADGPGTMANLRNAVASGKDVPCLVKNGAEVPG
ncbi:hypothetical protein AB4212_44230, partial [Streptomyces sp. 2MCAF27]